MGAKSLLPGHEALLIRDKVTIFDQRADDRAGDPFPVVWWALMSHSEGRYPSIGFSEGYPTMVWLHALPVGRLHAKLRPLAPLTLCPVVAAVIRKVLPGDVGLEVHEADASFVRGAPRCGLLQPIRGVDREVPVNTAASAQVALPRWPCLLTT